MYMLHRNSSIYTYLRVCTCIYMYIHVLRTQQNMPMGYKIVTLKNLLPELSLFNYNVHVHVVGHSEHVHVFVGLE